ncbi:MAG: translation initiation factor IF-3 [Planctomycetota bacterium]|jgi:translation initiation factor IF-3
MLCLGFVGAKVIARRFYFRPERPTTRGPRTNERIRATLVRLIGSKGEQMGIVPIADALGAARAEKLDLVEVAPDAKPPVCKLMDHGKHKFEEEKRRRESRKKETSNKLRLVRFRPNIGDHAFEVKMRTLVRLLEAGEKCRVNVTFRRREMRHIDVGVAVLDRVAEQVKEVAKIESRTNRLDGRDIGLTCVPLRAAASNSKKKVSGRQRVTGGKKARKAALAGSSDELEPQGAAPAEAPKAEAPKAEAPKADAPKADAPKAEARKADAPKAKAEAEKADSSA